MALPDPAGEGLHRSPAIGTRRPASAERGRTSRSEREPASRQDLHAPEPFPATGGTGRREEDTMSRTAWRAAGFLAVGHVVLVLAGISLQRSPRMGDDATAVADAYVAGDLPRILAGGYIEALGFVLLVPVVAFLARAVGRRTELGAWAAQTAFAGGIGYIGMSLAPGLAAGAAALYGAQHGTDLATVTAVNDVRNVAYFLSMLLLAVHTAGVAVSALSDRVLPHWLGWSGLATGLVLVGSVPFAEAGAVDYATLVWILWFLALAGVMLRHRPAGADASTGSDRPAVPVT
jgi:hypothetical protein